MADKELREKTMKVLCKIRNCSDMNNKQYPECVDKNGCYPIDAGEEILDLIKELGYVKLDEGKLEKIGEKKIIQLWKCMSPSCKVCKFHNRCNIENVPKFIAKAIMKGVRDE